MSKYRTHYPGLLTDSEIGKTVTLSGWVLNIRDHGGVIFVDLKDETGVIQLVSNDDSIFHDLTKESTIKVVGTLRKRDEDDYNPKIKTGELEVLVETVEVLGKCKNALPFEVISSTETSEDIRLKYRFLDLRNEKVHDNIMYRNKVIDILRTTMKELDFTEFQTPILTASSPEGARDFIVPSRKYKGSFYALPQAPQMFKQLLMVSGFDKYFQVAPCFRDEDSRSDRLYGEFYQLDLEMAFVEQEDIFKVTEHIFNTLFDKFDLKIVEKQFPIISYKESIEKYGTDKPDLRNPLIIKDVTEILRDIQFKPFNDTTIKAIVVKDIADKPNSWFNEIVDFATNIGMPGIGYLKVMEDMTFNGPIDKFLTETLKDDLIKYTELDKKDVIFFIADKKQAPKLAGLVRDELGKKLGLIKTDEFYFCIVNDFPMYEFSEDKDAYDFSHNPFSMPQGGIEALDTKDIKDILAYQFDIVCNGLELVSGAIRNHDLDIMKRAFELAGYTEKDLQDKFKALYTAFQYGAPPHGGMAIGIDRMIMMMKDCRSIRETVAFPMTSSGQDLLMGSPSTVDLKQLREVHIKIN